MCPGQTEGETEAQGRWPRVETKEQIPIKTCYTSGTGLKRYGQESRLRRVLKLYIHLKRYHRSETEAGIEKEPLATEQNEFYIHQKEILY